MPKSGWPGAGRPEEPGTHGTHEHPLGWDPLGNKAIREGMDVEKKLARYGSLIEELHSRKQTAIKQTLETPEIQEKSDLLNEDNILPD